MRWYYFYTPDYSEWHAHIQEALGGHFELQPIVVETLAIHDSHPSHHFTGNTNKLELMVDCIRANLGARIVFSDVTWYFDRERASELAKLVAETPCPAFAANSGETSINLGICVIDCTEGVAEFWDDIIRRVLSDSNLHDQGVVGQLSVGHMLLPADLVVANWPSPSPPKCLALKIFTPSYVRKSVRDSFRRQVMARYGYALPPDPHAAQFLASIWPPH